MKVISIQQPWASLIINGHKEYETRSWATRYRGPVLIHACAGMPKLNRSLLIQHPFAEVLAGTKLDQGAIIGMAHLRHVFTSEALVARIKFAPRAYKTHEIAFGDYSPGRFGWLLQNVIKFDASLPAKGQLGLWNFPDEKLLEAGISRTV
jgi:activating signal cointegrator 1